MKFLSLIRELLNFHRPGSGFISLLLEIMTDRDEWSVVRSVLKAGSVITFNRQAEDAKNIQNTDGEDMCRPGH